jgi:hypothetical protein
MQKPYWNSTAYKRIFFNLKQTKCRKRCKDSMIKRLTCFLFFKDIKVNKFQVIRGSKQKFRNGLKTLIFVIVCCCCCLQSRHNSNSCKGSRFSHTAATLFRIACRGVSECSWISGMSWKRHRRSYDFILGNKNISKGQPCFQQPKIAAAVTRAVCTGALSW